MLFCQQSPFLFLKNATSVIFYISFYVTVSVLLTKKCAQGDSYKSLWGWLVILEVIMRGKMTFLLLYNICRDGVKQLRAEQMSLEQKQSNDVSLIPTSFFLKPHGLAQNYNVLKYFYGKSIKNEQC